MCHNAIKNAALRGFCIYCFTVRKAAENAKLVHTHLAGNIIHETDGFTLLRSMEPLGLGQAHIEVIMCVCVIKIRIVRWIRQQLHNVKLKASIIAGFDLDFICGKLFVCFSDVRFQLVDQFISRQIIIAGGLGFSADGAASFAFFADFAACRTDQIGGIIHSVQREIVLSDEVAGCHCRFSFLNKRL